MPPVTSYPNRRVPGFGYEGREFIRQFLRSRIMRVLRVTDHQRINRTSPGRHPGAPSSSPKHAVDPDCVAAEDALSACEAPHNHLTRYLADRPHVPNFCEAAAEVAETRNPCAP
jgi:hypothetical protein